MNKKLLNTALTVGAIMTGMAITTPAHANDDYCRDFNQKIKINGQFETAYGRACLQPNGTWKIVSKDDHDDYETSHYKVKKVYTHSVPYRVSLYWGNGHRYYGHGYRHKKRHKIIRNHHKKHQSYSHKRHR